jgi:hypothetical protein
MIQGCWYLRRSTDRWLLWKNSTTRLDGLECWHGRFVVILTLRIYIYTLVLTWLLEDHDYNIYYPKITPWRHVRLVSITNSPPSLHPIHVITYSRMLPLSSVEQFFCRMMMYSRPQMPHRMLGWNPPAEWCSSGKFGSHVISERSIEVDKAKVETVEQLPLPTDVKSLRSYLGHAKFYRRFIKDFSKITKP